MLERQTLLDEDEDERRVAWFFNVRRRKMIGNSRRFLAELVGTFLVTFFACLATILPTLTNGVGLVQDSATAVAFVTAALILALGIFSGAHFNPAITLAFFLRRQFRWWRVPIYWLAQMLGAILAGGLIYAHFGRTAFVGSTIPALDDRKAFGLEMTFTATVIFVVLQVADKGRLYSVTSAVAVGAVLGCLQSVGSPLTGASMNPARSFGPMIYFGGIAWHNFWVYVIAPLVGALISVMLSYVFYLRPVVTATRKTRRSGTSIEESPLASE